MSRHSLSPQSTGIDEDTVIYELDMIWSVEIDSGFSGEQSVAGTPSNLGLILEHITILTSNTGHKMLRQAYIFCLRTIG